MDWIKQTIENTLKKLCEIACNFILVISSAFFSMSIVVNFSILNLQIAFDISASILNWVENLILLEIILT